MKGYDVSFENPGLVSQLACQVCGEDCLVERNRVGPTTWSAAMANAETVHDYFHCPNAGIEWHEQALALIQEIETTPSKRVAAMMRQDLFELLSEHGCNPEKTDA